MARSRLQSSPALVTAMVCAGAVSAQFIAGKATRDALYLANLDVTSLPTIVIATAAFSILLLAVTSRGLRHVPPGTLIPAMFAVNAVLLLMNWVLAWSAPAIAATVVYLLISGFGLMLRGEHLDEARVVRRSVLLVEPARKPPPRERKQHLVHKGNGRRRSFDVE